MAAIGRLGLLDRPRPGRPRQYDETVREEVIRLARTRPQTLGYPFTLWTVARRQRAVTERLGVRLALSTIWKWLRWQQQLSWFTVDRQDSAFVAKRGRSWRRIGRLLRSIGSSASTKRGWWRSKLIRAGCGRMQTSGSPMRPITVGEARCGYTVRSNPARAWRRWSFGAVRQRRPCAAARAGRAHLPRRAMDID